MSLSLWTCTDISSLPGLRLRSCFLSGTSVITRGTVLTDQISDSNKLRIGLGLSQLSRTELFRGMRGLAVKMTEPIYDLPSCNGTFKLNLRRPELRKGILQGDAMLQNLPSVVTAHVLNPQPGWSVLDMCASPGGKTTSIAELMQDQGQVIALDRTHKKVFNDHKTSVLHHCLGCCSPRIGTRSWPWLRQSL